MIYCKELDKEFSNKDEMLVAIKDNLKSILDVKKSVVKHADCYTIVSVVGNTDKVMNRLKEIALKSLNPINKDVDFANELDLPDLKVTAVTNTTNWFDSHRDVHIKDIWKQSLKMSGGIKQHNQEHKGYQFQYIIDDESVAKIINTSFNKLGFDCEGTTQALVATSIINPKRNIFMYNQYANGWVKNHSVEMYYVKILYCADTNIDDMAQYKANFDKYYPDIANKADVDEVGYFYAILEAKYEGFASVPKGSNNKTPTISVQATKSLLKEFLDLEADEVLEQKEEIPQTEVKKYYYQK